MMDIEIIEEKDNPLLERKEVVVKIRHHGDSTPKRNEIREKLIAKLSADSTSFILGSVEQSYGASEALARVKIYKNKDRALQIERPHIIKKNFIEEKKKVEVKGESEKTVEETSKEVKEKPFEEKTKEPEVKEKTKEPEVKEKPPEVTGKKSEETVEKPPETKAKPKKAKKEAKKTADASAPKKEKPKAEKVKKEAKKETKEE